MKLFLIGVIAAFITDLFIVIVKKNTVGTVITTGFRIVYVQIHSRPTDAHRVF